MKMHKNLAFDEQSSHHSLFTKLEKLKKIDSAEFVFIFDKSLNVFGSQLILLKRDVIGGRHAHTQLHLNWIADLIGSF